MVRTQASIKKEEKRSSEKSEKKDTKDTKKMEKDEKNDNGSSGQSSESMKKSEEKKRISTSCVLLFLSRVTACSVFQKGPVFRRC